MNASTSSGTGFARLEIRRLDVGEQAPLEARAQTRFERLDLFGRAIARDHELLLRFVQRVERVEELLLGLFFALEELDVVDQENVDVPVAIAELDRLVVLDRDDEFVGELLARHVDDVRIGIGGDDAMTDRMHEVGLSQPHAAVQE
jgi:hypothetical protein